MVMRQMQIVSAAANKRKEELENTSYSDDHVDAAKRIQRVFRLIHGRQSTFNVFKKDIMVTRARRQQIAKQVNDMCTYVVFLFFFTISAVVIVQEQDLFHFGNNIKGQLVEKEFLYKDSKFFKDFSGIATWDEFYQWMEGPMYLTLWTSSTHDGRDEYEFPGYVFQANRIIGAVRIGQLRSKVRDCETPNFKMTKASSLPLHCYGDRNGNFDLSTEDKADFGRGPRKFTFDGWDQEVGKVDEERNSFFSSYRTGSDRSYVPPSFAVLLPNDNATEARLRLAQLRDGSYADAQTKAVFVDITFYNPHLNYFLVFRASIESGKAGGIIHSYQMNTVRLYSMFESPRVAWIACEVIVVAFYAYFIVVEIRMLMKHGKKYAKQLSTLAHNANIAAYLLVWGFRLASLLSLPEETSVEMDGLHYYNFRMGAVFKSVSVYFNSMNAFLCWFKLVRYLSYIPRYGLVTGTLMKSASGVSGFGVVFVVVFYGFAAAHMMTFGPRLSGYKNLTSSVYSLLKSLLGDFDLDELVAAQWFMGPLFFVSFIGLAVFVVLNVLIAIISDAYTEQREQQEANQGNAEVATEMRMYIATRVEKIPLLGSRLAPMLKGNGPNYHFTNMTLAELQTAQDYNFQREAMKSELLQFAHDLKRGEVGQATLYGPGGESKEAPVGRMMGGSGGVKVGAVRRPERESGGLPGAIP